MATSFAAGSQEYDGYLQDANGQFERPLQTGGQGAAGTGWGKPFDGPFGGTTEAAASGLNPDGPYAADKQINHPYVPGATPAERNHRSPRLHPFWCWCNHRCF